MAKIDKQAIIKKYQQHDKDTGSAPVQIAILTNKIVALSSHLKDHHKDNHSRRGLLGMVGDRRKLLKYLKETDTNTYKSLIEDLGLRK